MKTNKEVLKKLLYKFFDEYVYEDYEGLNKYATKILDSLELSEEKLTEIACNACGCGYCNTCRKIIKAIAQNKEIWRFKDDVIQK